MPVSENYLLYDGECPFCSRYVALTKLRETVGPLRLINARDRTPELAAATRDGFVIDQGMLLHLDGQDYYGADCLNRLALLSSRSTLFNRISYAAFRIPVLARIAYPILRFGRNLALTLLGREKMGY